MEKDVMENDEKVIKSIFDLKYYFNINIIIKKCYN